MNNTKAPYNISSISAQIAESALSPEGWLSALILGISLMRKNVELLEIQSVRIIKALGDISRVGAIKGGNNANFILFEVLSNKGEPCNEAANKVYKEMAEAEEKERVVVRFRGREMGCFGCLRASVGSSRENDVMLARLWECLESDRN
jgi:histidinol-phosphate aminotransferase